MSQQTKNKTWSRELAFLMLLHLVYLSVESPELMDTVIWPYVTFMIYAFGAKQEVVKGIATRQTQGIIDK